MLVHWIWLSTRPNMGDHFRRTLLEHFRDPEDVFYADASAYSRIEGMTESYAASLMDKQLESAWGILEMCDRKAIRILTYGDAGYPGRLRNIPDPPMVLYYKGRLPDFDARPFIGVVGTRKASAYGIASAQRMGFQIAQCGGAVISGAAEGIDAAAMSGALTAGGTVIGVLGCGADVMYPACNRALFADTERYGCLLTEFIPGTRPHGWNFPRRNRIISGLSHGVLVVEAPKKSGALITAQQAADQGRDVFVVPGNIGVDTCEGSNALMRDGGILAGCGWDVVGEYEALFPGKLRPSDQPVLQTETVPVAQVAQPVRIPASPPADKKGVDKAPSAPYIDVEKRMTELNEQERAVVMELKQGEKLTDDVIAATAIPAGQMLSILTLLEIKGVIQRLPGNRIALK